MTGQKNHGCFMKRTWGVVAPSPARSFSRPDLAIPRRTTLRAVPASQQSSTPFHQAKISLPNLKVIAKKAGGAIHVLDRFHIMQKMPLIDERGGDRRGSCRRGQATEGRRLRGGAQTFPLVFAQAAGEPDRQADHHAGGIIAIQSAVGASSLAARGLESGSGNT